MTDESGAAPSEETQPDARTRRRASRAAGPAGDADTDAATHSVDVPATVNVTVRAVRPAGPPRRRQPNARLVGIVAGVAALVALSVLGTAVGVLEHQHRRAEAIDARDQRFIATASQTVVNMFSYTQDTVEESVDRFVNGTSGPLRDTMAGNAENLKIIFRETRARSEAVINAAALEGVDNVGGNASVLVATRVTVTDIDGINKPSQPYRLRVIVHEDDHGDMSAYDLKYPNGGN